MRFGTGVEQIVTNHPQGDLQAYAAATLLVAANVQDVATKPLLGLLRTFLVSLGFLLQNVLV
jgi:hypothetical protein